MRTIAAVLTIIFLMMVGTTVWAEDQVVTIYFAGTSATDGWWDWRVSCFGNPELLAVLYKEQKESETNHKKFINGVGTDYGMTCGISRNCDCKFGCGENNQSKTEAGNDECRGWDTCLYDATYYLLYDILPKYQGQVILNLVGWSRGGVLTMRFVHKLRTIDLDIYATIKRINILAVDPAGHRSVAGYTLVDPDEFCLNEKVKQYVGIYATDERTWMFGPAIPDVSGLAEDAMLVGVPGSHETLVGSIETDGHAGHENKNCGGLECYNGQLYRVGAVAAAIAKKLLGSSQWGNVEFDSDWPWSPGQDYESRKKGFIYTFDAMWEYDYSNMRRNPISSLLDFEGVWPAMCVRYWEWEWELFDLWKVAERCASLFSCPGEHRTVSLEDHVPKPTGSEVWAKLEQLTNSPPVGLCKDATVSADSTCKGFVLIDNGSFGPDGPITISQSPSGPYSLGNTSVTLTVTDSKGASSQCSGTVTVIDNTPPSAAAPAAVSRYTGPGATSCGATISNESLGTVAVNDNCPGVIVIPSGIPAKNFFPVGTTTITYTAKDVVGNTASATQVVTVIDNTPPSITNVSANPSTLWPPNYEMVNVTVNYNATDNCTQPVCQISSVTSNEAISRSDYFIVDAHHVELTADRLGTGNGRIYTIGVTCMDASNNPSSQTVMVSVPHDQGK